MRGLIVPARAAAAKAATGLFKRMPTATIKLIPIYPVIDSFWGSRSASIKNKQKSCI